MIVVTKPNRLYVVGLIIKGETSSWYVDFKVIQHVCHQLDGFTDCRKYDNEQYVYLEDNMTIYKIKGYGNVKIRLLDSMEKIIPKIIHILGLAKNLFLTK